MEYLENKFFLLAFTFGVFFLSRVLQKKTGWVVLNPILLTIAVLILFLKFTGISYEIYNEGGHLIEFWLKPAVVALGVPLYLQLEMIKKQLLPIVISQLAGCLVGLVAVVVIAKLLGATPEIICSLAPKSVTTPIAMEVSKATGGIPSLTAAVVVVVGLFGAVFGFKVLRVGHVGSMKEMGYTHIELMGISEYPFDGSWGYQVTGYYAPTSRYGTPQDFAYFINECHKHKISVILDWVPAHFPKDAHGLAEFDGTCLYEYADPRKGEHPDWGTKIFDYGKNEVKNFLIGSALMWIEHYHIDGLRVDAVASMLYLDYGKQPGQWVPNKYGDNKNLEAVEFFKHVNTLILGRNPGAVMIAEESTAWPKVTGRVEDDGLNFSYKWNMGWMHDFLDYMKLDPYFRKDNHHKMTFAMSYNESEKYILVLSHDEVVHLKCSMINKMPGEMEDKFKNLMVGYAFMMGHPGKKLLFMGQEFAQLQEWSEARELDWYLLENPDHKHMQNWVKKLLHIYQKNPALYELDSSWGGFEWINANDAERSIFSFIRKSKDGKNNLLFVCNFTPVERSDYRVGVPKHKTYKLILNSDDAEFGGSGKERPVNYKSVSKECDGRPYSFAYPLPGFGVAVFRY